jgi:hypothetical protein
MSQASVQHILEMIDQLSESDRETLQRQIAERAEAEWRQEAEDARREARRRGVDQKAIDDAVDARRYGP